MNADDRSFEIRIAKPEDAAALVELFDELGFPAAVGVVAQRLSALADGGETVFVGTRGVEVLGFVTLT